jgi:hypothetical protein
VPWPAEVPRTNASFVETKVTEVALNPAGTGPPEGWVGVAGVAVGLPVAGLVDVGAPDGEVLADVGAPDGELLVAGWPPDPQAAAATISMRKVETRTKARDVLMTIWTWLSFGRTPAGGWGRDPATPPSRRRAPPPTQGGGAAPMCGPPSR